MVYWKNKPANSFEIFSSLKNFCLSYPGYNYNTMNNYLSKAKTAYENENIRVERKIVIQKPKKTESPWTRAIVPVVRKIRIIGADDQVRDLEYWLEKPVSERLLAVRFLTEQQYPTTKRMDKTKVVKEKINR